MSVLAVMFMTMQPVQARPEPIADDRAAAAIAAALKVVVKDFIAAELKYLARRKKRESRKNCHSQKCSKPLSKFETKYKKNCRK